MRYEDVSEAATRPYLCHQGPGRSATRPQVTPDLDRTDRRPAETEA
jgi:hypothetical protein